MLAIFANCADSRQRDIALVVLLSFHAFLRPAEARLHWGDISILGRREQEGCHSVVGIIHMTVPTTRRMVSLRAHAARSHHSSSQSRFGASAETYPVRTLSDFQESSDYCSARAPSSRTRWNSISAKIDTNNA